MIWASIRSGALLLTAIALTGQYAAGAETKRPNILLFLADDMGFSDIGCYGGEIKTPNLDALASGGLRFTQFYNTARCWPTRASLLTGYYAQSVRRDAADGERRIVVGKRPTWARLLPEMLKGAGYRTYHSGKWHLDGASQENGFDRSYRLEDTDRYFNPRAHFEDDRPLKQPAEADDFYASTAIADHLIKYLKEHGERHAGAPFFAYCAFTAPHFPLHAPAKDIRKYDDAYLRGWDQVREERWKRLAPLGMIAGRLAPAESVPHPLRRVRGAAGGLAAVEVERTTPWAELSGAQRALQAQKMAVYAAMVDRMDQEIGRAVDQVRTMGALDNTVIIFLSDNGASPELFVRGDGHDAAAALGSAGSFICLGPGWSAASNTPFRFHKKLVHEGGISTPLIFHWPVGIRARGELRKTPGHVVDIVPTALELAGIPADAPQPGHSPPRNGVSLLRHFDKDRAAPSRDLWWFHEGNRAIRRGNFKLVARKDEPWELYDLSVDRCETENLAESRPDLAAELEEAWEIQLEQCHRLATMDEPHVE